MAAHHNSMTSDSFHIAFQNVQGFQRSKNILKETVSKRRIHVLCLAETWHQPPTPRRPTPIRFPDFTIYEKARDSVVQRQPRGGVAICVQNALRSTQHLIPPEILEADDEEFEIVAADVWITRNEPTTFFCLYLKPNQSIPVTVLRYAASLQLAVVAGDFNARHVEFGDHNSNPAGTALLQFLDTAPSIERVPSLDFTCHSFGGASTPDHLLFTTGICNYLDGPALVPDPLSSPSDHDMLVASLNTLPPESNQRSKVRVFGEEAQLVFHTLLSTTPHITPPTTPEEIDEAADQITKSILDAYNTASKEVDIKRPGPLLPKHARDLIRDGRRIRRKIHRLVRSEKPVDPQLRKQYNWIKAKIKRATQQANSDRWTKFIEDLHPKKGKNFWNALKALRVTPQQTPSLLANDVVHSTPVEKASCFAETLAGIFQEAQAEIFDDNNHYRRVERALNSWDASLSPGPLNNDDGNNPIMRDISPEEVSEVIAERKKCTSPGPNGVTWKMMKHTPTPTRTNLATLYTAILRLGYWPSRYLEGTFIMIPKPGKDHSSPHNYRPICLLQVESKLLELIINKRMRAWAHEGSIIPPTQHAFRKQHSTTTAILRLNSIITRNITQKRVATVLFLDYQRAFDAVSHRLLIYKLRQHFNLPTGMVRVIWQFLTRRRCRVRVKGHLSDPFTPAAGTPQGSPLSPLLYSLFCADCPSPAGNIHKQEYADDSLYITTGKTVVQSANLMQRKVIPALTKWCKKWKIQPNPQKSVLMHFRRHYIRLADEDRTVRFWGSVLSPSAQTTYLGVEYAKSLSWKVHFTKVLAKARSKSTILSILKHRKGGAHPQVTSAVVNVILRPTFLYAITALGELAHSMGTRITSFDRRIVRKSAFLPFDHPSRGLYAQTKQTPIAEVINKRKARQLKSLIPSLEEGLHTEITTLPGGRRRFNRKKDHKLPILDLIRAALSEDHTFQVPPVIQRVWRYYLPQDQNDEDPA